MEHGNYILDDGTLFDYTYTTVDANHDFYFYNSIEQQVNELVTAT